jgi:hypothetical protein
MNDYYVKQAILLIVEALSETGRGRQLALLAKAKEYAEAIRADIKVPRTLAEGIEPVAAAEIEAQSGP